MLLPLRDGYKIPQLGLGTWLSKPHEVENAVEIAVKNGYRHLDFAKIYENQKELRQGLKKVIPSVVKREELFITSKLWNTDHRPDQVEKALDDTLEELGLDYLDLYLIHWPVAFAPGRGLVPDHPSKKGYVELDPETSLVDTWKAMIALPKTKVKSIGVSNFTIEHLDAIIKATGVVPSVNQIEAHPLLIQDDLLKYCNEKNIHITAYSPLGNNLLDKPLLTEQQVVRDIATELKATPAQVLIAWGVYRGYSVIPKSVQEERIISNFKQIKLSKDHYEKITAFGRENYTRFNIPRTYTPLSWDVNVFNEPEEKDCECQIKLT